jgi:hypothetical protein
MRGGAGVSYQHFSRTTEGGIQLRVALAVGTELEVSCSHQRYDLMSLVSSNPIFPLAGESASRRPDRYARRRPKVQTTTATVPAPTASATATATSIANIVGTSVEHRRVGARALYLSRSGGSGTAPGSARVSKPVIARGWYRERGGDRATAFRVQRKLIFVDPAVAVCIVELEVSRMTLRHQTRVADVVKDSP